MTKIIAVLLFSVFLFLSLIHFYWAFGGKWGTKGVYPTKDDAVLLRKPGIAATLIVAIGLLGFGFFYMIKGGLVLVEIPSWLDKYGLWILTGIFMLRTIGDFNYLGFFKKIKNTKFAVNDTKYFSPLSLVIGILTFILELNN